MLQLPAGYLLDEDRATTLRIGHERSTLSLNRLFCLGYRTQLVPLAAVLSQIKKQCSLQGVERVDPSRRGEGFFLEGEHSGT